MSRSIRFKNSTYLDTSSIVHGRTLLSNYLNDKIGNFKCRTASTGENTYCTFDNMNDLSNPYDRRMYMYMFVGNNMSRHAGFFTLNNGVIYNQDKLLGSANITSPSNTSIKIDFGTNYGTCMLMSIFP